MGQLVSRSIKPEVGVVERMRCGGSSCTKPHARITPDADTALHCTVLRSVHRLWHGYGLPIGVDPPTTQGLPSKLIRGY